MAEPNEAVKIQRQVHDLRCKKDRHAHLLNRIDEVLAEESADKETT